MAKRETPPPVLYIEKAKLVEAFANADTDITADYGPDYGSESGYSRDRVAEIIESVPAAPSKIPCYCWQCDHFSRENPGHRPHLNGGYCYYWDYETGMAPNWVGNFDFCSNGSPDKDAVLPKELLEKIKNGEDLSMYTNPHMSEEEIRKMCAQNSACDDDDDGDDNDDDD